MLLSSSASRSDCLPLLCCLTLTLWPDTWQTLFPAALHRKQKYYITHLWNNLAECPLPSPPSDNPLCCCGSACSYKYAAASPNEKSISSPELQDECDVKPAACRGPHSLLIMELSIDQQKTQHNKRSNTGRYKEIHLTLLSEVNPVAEY